MTGFTKVLLAAVLGTGLMAAAAAHADTVVLQDQNRVMLGDWIISQNNGQCPAGSIRTKESHLMRDPTYRCEVPKGQSWVYYRPGTVLPSTVIS